MNYYKAPKKRAKSSAVYIVLALILVGVGFAAKNIMQKIPEPDTGEQTSFTSDRDDVNKIVSDITFSSVTTSSDTEEEPDPKPTTSAEQTQQNQEIVAKYFVLPVTGDIVKKFSDSELVYSATYNDMRLHLGVDIAAQTGTTIKSAGDGRVISAVNDSVWGTTVTIDHGNKIIGIYSGLNPALRVKEGDIVLSGQELGTLGTVPCESLDPPHLHFQMLVDSKPASPLKVCSME